MSRDLAAHLEAELATPAPDAVVALAAALADPARDAAVLYYGSTLRTGDLSGILDFYRLTRRPHRRGLRGLVERVLWPEVSYHEAPVGGEILRAKVATLPLQTFRRAAEGRTLDTTIWARFVQPAQRVWSADAASSTAAAQACAAAVVTAARYGRRPGPGAGSGRGLLDGAVPPDLRRRVPGGEHGPRRYRDGVGHGALCGAAPIGLGGRRSGVRGSGRGTCAPTGAACRDGRW